MTSEEYRLRAREFVTCARLMSNPHDRAMLIDVAAYWMELAERAEGLERLRQSIEQAISEPT